ncbi:hypothetical protein XELAEV_18002371mg [Xenopus laevis]|nr:hypothetical protein XELAEV_18002371mg [Xenopus laevis]
MKIALVLLSLLALTLAESNISPPVVKVYTAEPVDFGKTNEVICYVYNYHPPLEIPDCKQTDPSFQHNWKYYTTKSTHVHIDKGDKVECVVSHNGNPSKKYRLDIF